MNAKSNQAADGWASPPDRTSQTDDQRIKDVMPLPPPEHLIRFFPVRNTPIEGLVLCGAGVFPGIGVPPVAVSGAMAAHSFVPAARQRALIDALDLRLPA